MKEKELASLFDAFYYRFVLRDVMAKIAPGTIVLLTISLVINNSVKELVGYIRDIPFWLWVILIALAWITGIAIQAIGELSGKLVGCIRYYPKYVKKSNENKSKKESITFETWHKKRNYFLNNAPHSERIEYERYVVITEACGIGCYALIFSAILMIIDGFFTFGFDSKSWFNYIEPYLTVLFVVIPSFIGFLGYMHIIMVKRAYKYLSICNEKILEQERKK